MDRLPLKKTLEKLTRNDEQFVYFIAFLYALATGEVGSVDLIKTGGETKYGKHSKAFQEVFRLGVGWSFGLSKSCEMIALKISNKNDQRKQLLVKLAQVVRLGDEMKTFFRDELAATIHIYAVKYESNLESQKLFLEMFYTISSTASFMIAANSIMAMLMGQTNSQEIFITSLIGIIVSMSGFIVIMYVIFPRDTLIVGGDDMQKKFRLWLYMSIAMGSSLGLVLYVVHALPLPLIVVISTATLFIPGMMARKIEANAFILDTWYPSLIRHFGQIYATVGSMGQSLDAVLRSDFGPLEKHIVAFKNRIKNRIYPELAFDLFSQESATYVITSGNAIMAKALQKGSDINDVGNKIADISSKFNELRSKRRQTSKTFETILIVLHGLTMAIFGLMSKLVELFHNLLSTVPVSNQAIALSPMDPAFMANMMPIVILSISTINALAVKVGQGGFYKTVWFNIALFCVIGGVAMYGTDLGLSQFLTSDVLDLTPNAHLSGQH